jgi:hypothetical protein
MDREQVKKAYLPAAAAAAGITAAVFMYTVVVELLAARGYAALLRPPAAYAVKYACYIIGLSPVLTLRLTGGLFGGKRATPAEALKALTVHAIFRAAACEVPAIAGLALFLTAGSRADFYVLAVFSLALEIYNFPRLAAWEEELRGDFGQL